MACLIFSISTLTLVGEKTWDLETLSHPGTFQPLAHLGGHSKLGSVTEHLLCPCCPLVSVQQSCISIQ